MASSSKAAQPAVSSSSSAAQPAVSSSRSAADPAACAVVAFYNITWDSGRCQNKRHEETLAQDLQKALNEFEADLVLLSGCGEVGVGHDRSKWLPMIRDICGPDFLVCHQSHYTSIVRQATVEVTKDHRQELCTISYSPSLERWRCGRWGAWGGGVRLGANRI